jgi:hypothetical protein
MGTDAATTPPEHVHLYDEKLLMLHGSYMLNYHREVVTEREGGREARWGG